MSNNNSGKVRDILIYLVNEWHYCEGGWDENDVPLGVPEAEAKLEAYISSKVNEERSFAEFYMTNESRKKYRYHIKEHDKDSDRIRTIKEKK